MLSVWKYVPCGSPLLCLSHYTLHFNSLPITSTPVFPLSLQLFQPFITSPAHPVVIFRVFYSISNIDLGSSDNIRALVLILDACFSGCFELFSPLPPKEIISFEQNRQSSTQLNSTQINPKDRTTKPHCEITQQSPLIILLRVRTQTTSKTIEFINTRERTWIETFQVIKVD